MRSTKVRRVKRKRARRLIFEEEEEKITAEVKTDWKKLLKRSVLGGAIAGPLRGGLGGASSVETQIDRSIVPGDTSRIWFSDLASARAQIR